MNAAQSEELESVLLVAIKELRKADMSFRKGGYERDTAIENMTRLIGYLREAALNK